MRVHTIGFVTMLALALLVASRPAAAQPRGTLPKVGVLAMGGPPTSPSSRGCHMVFRQGLHDLGYVDGQTILFESRYAEFQPERLPALAAELIQLAPDVLFTNGTPAVQAARQATTTIPIVVGTGHLLREGLITNLARPGGNITGMTHHDDELEGKRLALLKEAVPQIMHVAILRGPHESSWGRALPETFVVSARALGVELHLVEVRTPDELEGAFATMAERRVDALIIGLDAMLSTQYRRITELAVMHRLPTMGSLQGFVARGGLLEYRADTTAMCRRAATYVDKILKGAKPGELPVERTDTFSLVVNLKTAAALGLTLSPIFLFQADEVLK